MSAHTPGPWQACSCGHCGLVWSLPGDYCVADVLGADSALADQEPLPKEAREANARLIAAAPDLLAEAGALLAKLRYRLDSVAPSRAGSLGYSTSDLDGLSNAIAKAVAK